MTHLIQIGNSRGVRIPSSIIQQAGLEDVELEFKVVPDGLLITSVQRTREGWADACQAISKKNEDKLIIPDSIMNQFDEDEWEW
jgi:antitoxin MazE